MPTTRAGAHRARRQTRGKFRLHQPEWIDPYPSIIGTNPEKRIFAELIRRKMFFIYHGGSPKAVKDIFPQEPDHDVDFRLPEYRVILDPFDPYGHSKADSVARDARKRALFAEAGYVTYYMWVPSPGVFIINEGAPEIAIRNKRGLFHVHFDKKGNPVIDYRKLKAPGQGVFFGAAALIDALPLLNGPVLYPLTDPKEVQAAADPGYLIGSHYGTGAGAVAAANRARARPHALSIGSGSRRTLRSSGNRGGL